MVAHVLVGKYAGHLPLHRQAQIYARQGLDLDRSSLVDWVGHAARELRPVHARLVDILKASPHLFCDETRAPVLDPEWPHQDRLALGLARGDRTWGGGDPPATVFLYADGRGGDHAARHLGGFRGTLLVDGYAGYLKLTDPRRRGGPVSLAF